LNCGEEISGEFVVTGRNGAEVLNFIEKALDEIALAVKREIAIPLGLTVGLWRDHWRDVAPGEGADQLIGVVSLVCDQSIRIGIFDQVFRASQIVGLSRREHQIGGIAQSIDQSVDFGGQPAARAADGLITVFFRAPALC
jgi:hypothetical protein